MVPTLEDHTCASTKQPFVEGKSNIANIKCLVEVDHFPSLLCIIVIFMGMVAVEVSMLLYFRVLIMDTAPCVGDSLACLWL